MTTFSKFNYNALNYNSFRPHYPASFYKILNDYVHKGVPSQQLVKNSVDLGCATGITTYPLLSLSENVIGLDLSQKMIDGANSLLAQRCAELGVEDHTRIKFEQGSASEFLESHKDLANGIDLITAAQCIHWFGDYNLFFNSAANLLKSGGTLAYWYYSDPIVVGYSGCESDPLKTQKLKRAKDIYLKYVYEDLNFLGPYWEQPGRGILKNNLRTVNDSIPKNLFEHITIKNYEPAYESYTPPDELDLNLEKKSIPLDDFINYLRTYSSYHKFKNETGDSVNMIELFLSDLEKYLGWDRTTTKIDLVWNTGYTFLTKK